MPIHRDLTKKRRKGNGARTWDATVPLLFAPDDMARRFAQRLASIANISDFDPAKYKKMRGSDFRGPWFEFGVTMDGSGTMHGRIAITPGLRDLTVRWLSGLPKPRKPILEEMADALRDIDYTTSEIVAEPASGRLAFGINVAFSALRPESVLAFMIASVLERGYGKNIGRCPKKTKRTECGLWFVDFPKTGEPRKYCTTKHQQSHATYLSKQRNAK